VRGLRTLYPQGIRKPESKISDAVWGSMRQEESRVCGDDHSTATHHGLLDESGR
jgi:hypothetical protein